MHETVPRKRGLAIAASDFFVTPFFPFSRPLFPYFLSFSPFRFFFEADRQILDGWTTNEKHFSFPEKPFPKNIGRQISGGEIVQRINRSRRLSKVQFSPRKSGRPKRPLFCTFADAVVWESAVCVRALIIVFLAFWDEWIKSKFAIPSSSHFPINNGHISDGGGGGGDEKNP